MKKFVSISIFANIIGLVGWYLLAYTLNKEDFGAYAVVVNTYTILLPLITQMRERIIATSKSSLETQIEYNEFQRTLLTSSVISLPIIFIIISQQNLNISFVIITFLLLITNSYINLIKSELTSEKNYISISYINLYQQSMLVCASILAYFKIMSVLEVLLTCFIVVLPIIIKKVKKLTKTNNRSKYNKELIKIVTPSTLSESFTSNALFLIVTLKFDLNEVAYIVLVMRLVMFPLSNLSRIIQPVIIKEFSGNLDFKLLKKFLLILMILCLSYGMLQINIIDKLISILGNDWINQDSYNTTIICILCLQFFVSIYSQLLIAQRKLIKHSYAQFINVMLTIPLFFIGFESVQELIVAFLGKELIFRMIYFLIITRTIFYAR